MKLLKTFVKRFFKILTELEKNETLHMGQQ